MKLHGRDIISVEPFSDNTYKVRYSDGGYGLAHESALSGQVLPSISSKVETKWDKMRSKNMPDRMSDLQKEQERAMGDSGGMLAPSVIKQMMWDRLNGRR